MGLIQVYMARFMLTGPRAPTQSQADLVHDGLWPHLERDHGVEHITVTATPLGIDLVLFLRHGIDQPDEHARRIVATAFRTLPVLAEFTPPNL